VRAAYEKENEQLSISYIAALPAEFQKNISIEDAELKDYFSKNAQEFKVPISFNLEYLIFESEAQAVAASQILKNKDGFDKVSREMNMPIYRNGFFHTIRPNPRHRLGQ